jgi:hypothetical protein
VSVGKTVFSAVQYCLQGHQIKKGELGWACGIIGEGKCVQSLVGKPEGNKPLG